MKLKSLCKILIAILCGFGFGAICLYILNIGVVNAYSKLFDSIFSSHKNLLNCIIYTTPFFLTALSFCVAYKCGIFNIGIEGEFIISSIVTCATSIIFSSLPSYILIPLSILSGIIVAIIHSIIIYILKTYFNINEIFAMIIFNYIALHTSNFIVNLSFIKSPNGAETTKRISDNAIIGLPIETIRTLNLPSNTNFTFFIALIIAILLAIFFKLSPIGHNIENIKYNKNSAMLSGINVKATYFIANSYSAIIAGLAGSLYVLSIGKRISVLPAFENYGNTGVLIALFSKSNPIVTIFSSLFFGALKYAGRTLNIVNAPSQVIDLIISLIILIAATRFTIKKQKNNKSSNSINS